MAIKDEKICAGYNQGIQVAVNIRTLSMWHM